MLEIAEAEEREASTQTKKYKRKSWSQEGKPAIIVEDDDDTYDDFVSFDYRLSSILKFILC